MKLEGKVAIVTGGGQGIGRASALALAKEGADIVIADIDLGLAEKVVGEVKSLGRQAQAVKVNVFDKNEVNQMVEQVLNNFKSIDILVNSAGINPMGPALEESEEQWDRTMNINLKGTFLCAQAVARQMVKQKQGKIINIASISGHRGIPGMVSYCTSKAAVIHLTQVLAMEWSKYNINVNTVTPGITITPLHNKVMEDPEAFRRERQKSIPLRRVNEPEDVANVVLFLASPEADNITGQEIVIDGGICALHPGFVSATIEG